MANLEVNVSSTVCRKCGRAYGRLKGYFPISYGELYKGTGYLPYCWECVNKMYTGYLTECGSEARATEQLCRKLDIYWNEDLYRMAEKRTNARSVLTNYLSRLTGAQYTGKSYDDTLREEKRMWRKAGAEASSAPVNTGEEANTREDADLDDISRDTIAYWGPGYDAEKYQYLEQRRLYWENSLPDGFTIDASIETMIRQICCMEDDINRDRSMGKSVEKQVGMLDKLVNSLNQRIGKDGEGNAAFDKTPFGVWIDRWENKRPVAEPDPDFQDVDGVIRYITTWFLGHLCKMLGIKNTYCRMYEEALAEQQLEHPEIEEDDDEELFNKIFSTGIGDSG